MFSFFLFVGNEFLDLSGVGLVCDRNLAEISLALGALFVQNVGLEGMTAHGLAVLGELKTFFCSAVSFDFRHNKGPP